MEKESKKNSKFYWLKLYEDFFEREEIKIIEGMENGELYTIFYLKLLCKCLKSEGELRVSKEIPYNEQMLASITNTNKDVVKSAVEIFVALGLMEVWDDGTLFMRKIENLVGTETYWAQKKRLQREKQRKELLDEVQPKSNQCPPPIKTELLDEVQPKSNQSPTTKTAKNQHFSRELDNVPPDIDIDIDNISLNHTNTNSNSTYSDKETFGARENIWLTEGETEVLKKDFGERFDELIDEVSNRIYARQSGDPIKSYYSYIRAVAKDIGMQTEKELEKIRKEKEKQKHDAHYKQAERESYMGYTVDDKCKKHLTPSEIETLNKIAKAHRNQ